jgi:ParB family chromosome partitioning protein
MSKLNLKSALAKGVRAERDDSAHRMQLLEKVDKGQALSSVSGITEAPEALAPVVVHETPGQGLDVRDTAAEDAASEVAEVALPEGVTGVVGKRVRILIEKCMSNPFNPRTFYDEENIDQFADELEREGQIVAIEVTTMDEYPGMFVITDGERRKRARKSRGHLEIEAEIKPPMTPTEMYLRAYRANKDRDEQTIFDDAIAWDNLINRGVYKDVTALAIAIGESQPQVSKVRALAKLPESLLRRMVTNQKQVGLGHAYNIKLIYDRQGLDEADRLLQKVIDGEMPVRKLEAVVAALPAEGSTQAPRTRKPHYEARVEFSVPGGARIGQLKRFADGRLGLELEGIVGEQQQILAERLAQVVNEFAQQMRAEETAE